ncbi:MAG: Rrf2 family transcriptional regulator [Planctomycetota bacterium]
MVISARAHYSCLALLELARHIDQEGTASDGLVAAGEIRERHEIPGPFLSQILRSLIASGWVESIRGSQGGYRLVVDPQSISLLDIAEAAGCHPSQKRFDETNLASQVLCETWANAAECARAELQRVTLADIVNRCSESEHARLMFYI